MHVIVTDCHARFTLALIRELRAAGHEVTAVCEAGYPPLGLHCRQTTNGRLLPARLSEREYVGHLLDICAERRGSTLLPAGARTVRALSRHRDVFRPVARFLISEPDVLETSGDKLLVSRVAEQLSIPTPRSFRFESAQPVEKLAGQLTYPIVLKYRDGEKLGLSADRRYTIAKNPREFIRRYNIMHDVQPPVIMQEYIPGRGLGVSVLMDDQHRPVRVFCHERIRELPTSGGPSTACRSDWFPTLAPVAVKLLTALRFSGFAMVEFKGAPENAFLLEINPRLWGSYPLAALSGAGMASAYVDAVHGVEPLDPFVCRYKKDVQMQYFVSDCLAGLGYLRHGQAGKTARVLFDALSPKVKGGVFSKGDPQGSLYYVKSLFINALRRVYKIVKPMGEAR